jgi:hypothetical protein
MKYALVLAFVFVVLAQSQTDFQKWNSSQVIEIFKSQNLEVGNTKPMTPDDNGLAPSLAVEGLRFLIPSLGEDKGGRVFSFDNPENLEKLKFYYDALGKELTVFFSHTCAKGNILIQANGELPKEQFDSYCKALDLLQ